MTEIEPIVEPDRIGNDIGRESVALVYIPPPILPVPVSLLVSTRNRPLKRPILSESIPGS